MVIHRSTGPSALAEFFGHTWDTYLGTSWRSAMQYCNYYQDQYAHLMSTTRLVVNQKTISLVTEALARFWCEKTPHARCPHWLGEFLESSGLFDIFASQRHSGEFVSPLSSLVAAGDVWTMRTPVLDHSLTERACSHGGCLCRMHLEALKNFTCLFARRAVQFLLYLPIQRFLLE